jgi:hypothetical protein
MRHRLGPGSRTSLSGVAPNVAASTSKVSSAVRTVGSAVGRAGRSGTRTGAGRSLDDQDHRVLTELVQRRVGLREMTPHHPVGGIVPDAVNGRVRRGAVVLDGHRHGGHHQPAAAAAVGGVASGADQGRPGVGPDQVDDLGGVICSSIDRGCEVGEQLEQV